MFEREVYRGTCTLLSYPISKLLDVGEIHDERHLCCFREIHSARSIIVIFILQTLMLYNNKINKHVLVNVYVFAIYKT